MKLGFLLPFLASYIRSESTHRDPLFFLKLIFIYFSWLCKPSLNLFSLFSFSLKSFSYISFMPFSLSFLFFKFVQIKWVKDVVRRYFTTLYCCQGLLLLFERVFLSLVLHLVCLMLLRRKSCRCLYLCSLSVQLGTFWWVVPFPSIPETSSFESIWVFPLNLSRNAIGMLLVIILRILFHQRRVTITHSTRLKV